MNSIAKYLSQELTVKLSLRVHSMRRKHNKWYLEDDQGNPVGEYDWVISTIPAEQASELLPSALPFYPKIGAVKMKGCFSLMLGFENALPLEFDAAQVHGEDIGWVSVNSSKPSRNDAFCLLIHSTNEWADKHMYDDRDQVAKHLCNQTSDIIGHELSKASHQSIHGWRFANIEKQARETHFIDTVQNIAVCGDWFIQGRVEAAFTSGFEAANNILKTLNSGEFND
jgi:predicted NAD/FAD-dependent oxidoreductase